MVASELTSSDPLINQVIEGYHFVKRLGGGTYGLVYLARHPRIKDRLVAVKYIKLSNPREAQKVQREIDILARLKHPHVVDIYDAYRFDHYHLIVMELIRGGSLEESLLHIDGLLDLHFVIEGIQQLAYAMGYVHEQNILHLDLKPANILLDPVTQGQMTRFVLTDFGIAQMVNPDAKMSTNMIGTPMYMSPEHFGFGDSKPDHRSDIYSLGVILYELVVGHVPFQATQLLDLLNQHAYTAVPLASRSVPSLPPMLDNIILKAMAKSPADRFQSATELGRALHELLLGPMLDLQSETSGRAAVAALGVIAQQGARALSAIEAENAAPEFDDGFSLLVLNPDGSQQALSFYQDMVIVGRDKTTDLPLDQKTVSRQHLRIERDKTGALYVTDLNSANGSYLDGVRLLPEERVAWNTNQFLQIQGFLLQIVGHGAGIAAPSPALAATSQVVSLLNRLQDQNKKPILRMDLSPAIVYLELGKPQYIQVRVTTENTPQATYKLLAKPGPGMDESWYTLPAEQEIDNNQVYAFDFIVSMPAVGTVGGETHEIALQVISDKPEVPTVVQILKVRVVPFTRFKLALHPSEISHNRRRRANLVIANTGNHPESFTYEIEAPDMLKVTPDVQQVFIEPDEEKAVRLKFNPTRDARRMRTRMIYSVTVHAASGLAERTSGSYIFRHRERIPVKYIVLWVIVLVVIGRLILFNVSLAQQFAEVRALFEALIIRLRGG